WNRAVDLSHVCRVVLLSDALSPPHARNRGAPRSYTTGRPICRPRDSFDTRDRSDRGYVKSQPALKICCVITSLGAGGAERTVSLLANRWALRGQDVTVITLAGAADDHYDLNSHVKRRVLDLETDSRSLAQAVANNFAKIRGLRRAVSSLTPDVIISFV